MSDRVPHAQYPWWVRLSLAGVPGRGGVWACALLSLGGAVVCAVYGFRDARLFAGSALFVGAVALYGSAIRWVDRHGSWDADA